MAKNWAKILITFRNGPFGPGALLGWMAESFLAMLTTVTVGRTSNRPYDDHFRLNLWEIIR